MSESQIEKQIPEYQSRVINEKSELDDKIEKLHSFLSRENLEIQKVQLDLLIKQLDTMRMYSVILSDRISLFT